VSHALLRPRPTDRPALTRTPIERWLFRPMPLARLAWFRVFAYAFVPLDVLHLHYTGVYHAYADKAFYRPLLASRILHYPTPTWGLVWGTLWFTVAAALVLLVLALMGRTSRVLGWALALSWLYFQVIAFSYGKVDHDRLAFTIALFVLPTVDRAGLRDRRSSEQAGWALRMVWLGAVATYFLASVAKLRFGGLHWVNSATIARAVIRRGTSLSRPLLQHPWTLRATQWFIVIFELSSPIMLFVKQRWRTRIVVFMFGFHLITFLMITIAFYPHLVCLTAMLPLERLGGVRADDDGVILDERPVRASGATLVYDGDCAFCTECVDWADRHLPLHPRVIAWQHADLDALGLTQEQCERAVQWVEPSGRVRSGAKAVGAWWWGCGGVFWRVLAALCFVPPASWVAEGIYRLVAANRSRLPGGTAACAMPAHLRPGSHPSAEGTEPVGQASTSS
jgi:predicted DCC family thiol-disulfide oxidoreductase YuxK